MTPLPLPAQLVRLAEAPQHLDTCAGWLSTEWGLAEGYSLETTTEWVREAALQDPCEDAIVAIVDDLPVGIAMLVACDLPRRSDLAPWLSALYVLPAWRGRSIGVSLTKAVERLAAELGHPALYLYSQIGPFYEKLGWIAMDEFQLDGSDFVVMMKPLAATRPHSTERT